MKIKAVFIHFFCFIFINLCCTSTEPEDGIKIILVDFSCTEAWINVNGTIGSEIILKRNDIEAKRFTLISSSQTITDDSLLPNKNYSYQAIENGRMSNEINISTLDTTSHNFSWQVFLLGDFNSTLYDVAIINDTNIWAVGEIYLTDSSMQLYNLCKWNNNNWNYLHVYFSNKILDPSSTGDSGITSIKSIYAFNDKDIWLTAGTVQYWNGSHFQQFRGEGAGFSNKVWGNNSLNLFFVGSNGSIICYQNNNWKKIQAVTNLNLYDVYSNNQNEIYISGGNFTNHNGIVLKGNSTGFQTFMEGRIVNEEQLFNPYFVGVAKTIWVSKTNTVYFGGNLLYRYKLGKIELAKTLPGNFINGNVNGQFWGFISQIRGNADNDIIMAGEGNTLMHFNGVSWKQIGMPYDYNSEYTWLAVSMNDNMIVAVGHTNSQAAIIMLKRE